MNTGEKRYFLRLMTGFVIFCLVCLPVFYAMAQDDVLTVDAAESWGEISPYISGGNTGGYGVLPPALWEQARESGMKILRFPGGSIFDKDISGKREGDVDTFLIDVFMTICKQLGAEPSIQVRLDTGTPESAAAIVKYVNIDRAYNVRYWYIGNEPNLYNDQTIDESIALWREIAEAMLEVDPNILLIGPELSQYPGIESQNPKGANGKDWMDEFLKVNGDLVGIVSIHRYPFPQGMNNETTIDDLRGNAREWDVIIPYLRERIAMFAGEEKPVAVTEINSHWNQTSGGEASPDSHYHAIWYADVLGRMIRQQVQIVTYFELYGDGGRALSLMTPNGVRPTFYTYKLYSMFGTELVSAAAPDDLVTIYAAKREDGALTLMVVNLADDEQTRTLSLSNFTPGGDAEVFRLDAEHNAESIGTEEIADGTALTLPGQSITLYVIPAGD